MRTLTLLLAFLCLARPALPAPPAPLRGTTVLIIRHAEKASGLGLSATGQERAGLYPRYFSLLREGETPLRPDVLFATKDSDGSIRPRLTLEPLARAFGLPLNTEFKTKATARLAALLKSGRFAGHTVLICWHHGEIPELLSALGADPGTLLPGGEWPDGVYHWLIELRLAPGGTLRTSRIINEKLLPDDLRDPPEP